MGGYNWIRFEIVQMSLTAGTTYWGVVRRSGAVNFAIYYMLAIDDSIGYAARELKIWNGSYWAVQSEDLNFAVLGSEEASDKIKWMDARGPLRSLAGADWGSGMDWLGRLAEMMIGKWNQQMYKIK